jgi:hypothetical protein
MREQTTLKDRRPESSNPADRAARTALAARITNLATILEMHAEEEDREVQPPTEMYLPDVAEVIARDHALFELRVQDFTTLANDTVNAAGPAPRASMEQLYMELASFTGVYLGHQNIEERVVAQTCSRRSLFELARQCAGAIAQYFEQSRSRRNVPLSNPSATRGNVVNLATARREWDSNPRRVAPHTLSKRADSAALASLPEEDDARRRAAAPETEVARSLHISGDPAALERFR